MHMMSKRELSSEELDTLRRSRTLAAVRIANGEVHTHEEAQAPCNYSRKTPAVLSLGKLCEDYGYSYGWVSQLTKDGKSTTCKTDNLVPPVRKLWTSCRPIFYENLKIRLKYIFITEKLLTVQKAKCLFHSPDVKMSRSALPSSSVLPSLRTVAARDPHGFMWKRVLWLAGKHTGSTLLRLR